MRFEVMPTENGDRVTVLYPGWEPYIAQFHRDDRRVRIRARIDGDTFTCSAWVHVLGMPFNGAPRFVVRATFNEETGAFVRSWQFDSWATVLYKINKALDTMTASV